MEAKKVMKWTGIPLKVLRSKTRKREVVFARSLVFDFLVSSGYTLSKAGVELGKHHATVLNSISRLPAKMRQMYPEERDVLDSFRAGLNQFLQGDSEQDMFFSDEMMEIITNNQNIKFTI